MNQGLLLDVSTQTTQIFRQKSCVAPEIRHKPFLRVKATIRHKLQFLTQIKTSHQTYEKVTQKSNSYYMYLFCFILNTYWYYYHVCCHSNKENQYSSFQSNSSGSCRIAPERSRRWQGTYPTGLSGDEITPASFRPEIMNSKRLYRHCAGSYYFSVVLNSRRRSNAIENHSIVSSGSGALCQ